MVIATPLVEQLEVLLAEEHGASGSEDVRLDLLASLPGLLERLAASLLDRSERPYDDTALDWIRTRMWEIEDHLRWLDRATAVMSAAELGAQVETTTRELRDLLALIQHMPDRSAEGAA